MSAELLPIRVTVDGFILRRPPAGTARWLRGAYRSLHDQPGVAVSLEEGPVRLGHGGRLYRLPNIARERLWYERGIGRAGRRNAADVLLMPANLSARKGGLPQVVTILDVNFLTQPGTYEPAFVRYASEMYRRAARDADVLTTISEFSRSEIAEHLGVDPARIRVTYPGLDPVEDRARGASPHDRPYALYVGATERHKNVGLLLDAWAERRPGGLDLAIVGQPGRDHESIRQRASVIGSSVRLVGRVDEEALERWYRNAAVFLFPSRVEGFGYPPLEAMARGVPVVASRAGSLPEVLGDAALYIDPSDPDGLLAAVEALAGDRTLADEYIRRGLAQAPRYRWDATGAELAALLRLAAGRGRP